MTHDPAAACALLRTWIGRTAGPRGLTWLDGRLAEAAAGGAGPAFFMAFSAAGREVGRDGLGLDASDLDAADRARRGWDPSGWTLDQAARTLLVLHLPADDAESFCGALEKLFQTAEGSELVALYQALPLLPHPERHAARCAEGVRTNMTTVFTAVAHRNPYPAEQLGEGAWNQMILKALFVGVALDPVVGIDRRANPALARMLCDYAHERWAAKRTVSPELWRCVGPCADDAALADLARVLREGTAQERNAAVLALRACPRPGAAELLSGVEAPAGLSWSNLSGA